jgi:hypothetical protein
VALVHGSGFHRIIVVMPRSAVATDEVVDCPLELTWPNVGARFWGARSGQWTSVHRVVRWDASLGLNSSTPALG